MGILDFIIKKRREKQDMSKKEAKKKLLAKQRKHAKKSIKEKASGKVTKRVEPGKKAKKTQKTQKQRIAIQEVGGWSVKEAKEALLKLKEEILNSVNLQESTGGGLQREELIDEVDHTIEEKQKELSLMLNEREKAKLEEIEEALERIERNEYGKCEECGDEIPEERLKYIPYVRYCVDCQEKLEKEQEEESGAQLDTTKIVIPPGYTDTSDSEDT